MRIAELHSAAFGHLTHLRLSDLPNGPIVFLGPNEAGKSTLFHLIQTIFFGFSPVRDFPYRSWDAVQHPEISADLVLNSGEVVHVWRTLNSGPQSRLIRGTQAMELRNQALPWTDHVGRQLYQSLYALSQANMRSISREEHTSIEDRLLDPQGSDLFRPLREVWQELDSRAQKLWRSDNRGKPEYRKLSQDIQAARARRRQALEQDRTVRDKARRLRAVEDRITALERELARLKAVLRRADELLPVKQRLDQIRGWEARLGDREAVQALPQGVRAEVQRLGEKEDLARQELERLEQELESARQTMAAFTARDQDLLQAEHALKGWIRGWSAHEMKRQGLQELRDQVVQKRSSFELKCRQILNGPFHPGIRTELAGIVMPELKNAVDRVCLARDRLTTCESYPEVGSAQPIWWTAGLTLSLGGALCAAGWRFQQAHVLGGAVVLVVLGCLGLGYGLIRTRQERACRAGLSWEAQARDRARDMLQEERSRVASLLEGLPVDRDCLENPGPELVQRLHDLQLDGADLTGKEELLSQRLKQFKDRELQLRELMVRFGESKPWGKALNRLEVQLEQAGKRQQASDQARLRITELSRQADQALDRTGSAREQKERVLDQLRVLLDIRQKTEDRSQKSGVRSQWEGESGQGEEEGRQKRAEERNKREEGGEEVRGQGVEDLLSLGEELQKLLVRIEEAEERLEKEVPNLDQVKEEIRGLKQQDAPAWGLDPEKVERWRIQLARLQDERGELQTLREERASLRKDLDLAREFESVSELDSRIADLQEQMGETFFERDRFALMSAVLRLADRRFREKHQPDVIKRAGQYLKAVTNGRYERLALLEGHSDRDVLCVRTGRGDYRQVGPPLSSGTLDQIHLAFRLAVIDHLEQGQEPLPLFLDEALLNWDQERLTQGLKVLGSLAGKRQIGVFTCHEWLAEKIGATCKARVVDLRDGS